MPGKTLDNSVVVFFTDTNGFRYRANLLSGTFVFVDPATEADIKASLDASDVPWADEPSKLDRRRFGVEVVDPRKLVREYLLPALQGGEMPK